MDKGWIYLIGAIALIFILFLVRQNRKDEKKIVRQMNEDYHKSKDEEGDAEIDEVKK